MDERDEAIIELAHVAEKLVEALREAGKLPGIFGEAITNKIDYYRSFARTT